MAEYLGTTKGDGLIGGLFSDTIEGLGGDDLLVGLNGDDLLDGGSGKDVLVGGIGDDVMFGGGGSDKIVMTAGDDSVFGGNGNDVFFANGFAGDWSIINDSNGIDTLNLYGGITGARIDLTPGAVSEVDGRFIEIAGLSDSERPLDLVLVQDRSGSFSDDLTTIAGLLPDLVSSATGLASNVRLGLASFIDKPTSPFGASGDHEYQTELALTSDTAAWSTAVTGLTAFGGSDLPESQMTALLQVALRTSEVGWNPDALKVLVLTTDAAPHFAGDNPTVPNDGNDVTDGPGDDGTGEDYPTIEQVKDALLAAGIVPVFAVTSGVTADYQALVDAFGFGAVVPLSSDSSDIIAAFEDGINSAANTVIENAVGTMQADHILGNDAANNLKGLGGNDTILGGAGNDTLNGHKGDDLLAGGNGRDLVIMGDGNDVFLDNGQGGKSGQDTVKGGAGNDSINGGAGNDLFLGDNGNDSIKGGLGNDRLLGGNQNDTLFGNGGNDTITGGNGQDRAFLGSGNDVFVDNAQASPSGNDFVDGGAGNDTINAGGGDDTLTGGADADTFVFAPNIDDDTVTDYAVGVDSLHFSTTLWGGALDQTRLDALAAPVAGDLVFNFDNGDSLTLDGIGSTAGLLGDILLL